MDCSSTCVCVGLCDGQQQHLRMCVSVMDRSGTCVCVGLCLRSVYVSLSQQMDRSSDGQSMDRSSTCARHRRARDRGT